MIHDPGLSMAQAEERRRLYGANVLTPPPHRSAWLLLADKLKEPLILILTFASLISMVTGGWVEGGGILLAVLLSAGIGFIGEYRAGRAFDLLNRTDDDLPVAVYRDGMLTEIPRQDLVVGDVIVLETGAEAPADAEVLEAIDFQVDQSKFTGEPEPVDKIPRDHADFAEWNQNATYPPDRVLRGSPVLTGHAKLRVLSVGMQTELGKTTEAATDVFEQCTPLQAQLKRLSKVIAICGISLSGVLFGVLLVHYALQQELSWGILLSVFMVAVTLIVVTVPEGLPMSVTLSLACSMRKMARSNCLLRRLHAAETLGCATVICTDKTGTLTQNKMRCAQAFFPSADREMIGEALATNSTAHRNGTEVVGNPTEGALLEYLEMLNFDYQMIRQRMLVARQWSFTTETKYMATRLETGRLHMKGAPEIILEKCSKIQDETGIHDLDTASRATLLKQFGEEQSRGRRTLGFAYGNDAAEPEEAQDLVYFGFMAIADPVRADVPEAIQMCGAAGIAVKIVTGDTAATACEIARQINLQPSSVLSGSEFASLSEAESETQGMKLVVMARARPNDKLKLVEALQRRGQVVAVTGDGANDAPALHHADVGIAMGRSGTAIAREAADVILLDDAFSSIVNAVLWGRSLYLNIQRFLVFQLTINVAAAGIALLGPFLDIEMPFTVVQMLWINLIMDTLAALALATEPPTPEVMTRPPRRKQDFIVTRAMAGTIFGMAALFIGLFVVGWHAGLAGGDLRQLTILFSSFVMLQLWNLLNVRAWGSNRSSCCNPPQNAIFAWIVLGIAVAQIAITQYGGRWFRTEPLDLGTWLGIIGWSSLIFWGGEVWRWWRRRRTTKE